MPEFVDVAYRDTLKPGECKVVMAENQEIALYNVAGKFYATSNACLHKGGPLGDGKLDGKNVICPWHAWEFDVTTGENTRSSDSRIACFEVKISDDRIYVKI